ncbi:winged helix DNA-binding domain-containing protein [Arthrobacter castelli]|uniref:winged helix DNA-binding domain-containing protein n=1 Tax=Arthrobacter castelli TaxID=271431 RepID=UPI00047C393E|nr:winged helix DNA-binding domain-containing protein [Arthrobacter castelli]
MTAASRSQVLAYRWEVQGLRSEPGALAVSDIPILDSGVQDTGVDGARWALVNRGADPQLPLDDPDTALAWTLRSAPHLYRRQDLPQVAAAVRPFSNADAGKRIIDAVKPLKAAGIEPLDALDEVAAAERKIVESPTVKGELSGRLNEVLDEPYQRFCRPCHATHVYEVPFRISALQAGLELQPGSSPPVLQRIPGWPDAPPAEASERVDVIRNYLHFNGPATPTQVTGFLDGALADVKARWPDDAVEVEVDGQVRWMLADDVAALEAAGQDGGASDPENGRPAVRLLGPYDPYLQVRDRELLVPDAAQRKTLWPTLGRPGAVLAGGDVVGAWRPRMAGKKLTVRIEDFGSMATAGPWLSTAVEHQAELLAGFRGVRLAAVEYSQ